VLILTSADTSGGFNWDAIAVAVAVVSALISVWAVIVSIRANRAAKDVATRQLEASTRPLLINHGPPETVDHGDRIELRFNVRNGGEGVAAIRAYGIRDTIDPTTNRSTLETTDFQVPPDDVQPFKLEVTASSHAWFADRIRQRNPWAYEVTYCDGEGLRRVTRAFGVAPAADRGWRINGEKQFADE
jgi:hypothetical protein